MAALLRPHPATPAVAGHRPLRLVVDNTAGPANNRRPGRTEREPLSGSPLPGSPLASEFDVRAVATMAIAVAVAVFATFFAIRVMQGSPSAPAAVGGQGISKAAVDASAVAVSASGDQIVMAQPGDSMWSIAQSVAPGSDPRPVVAALIEANGGDSVQIGQQIVIPKQLLD